MPEPFFVIWIIGMGLGLLFNIGLTLWIYKGQECFLVDRNTVKLRKTVFGIGYKKTLDVKEIKNFRLNDTAPAITNAYNTKQLTEYFKGAIQFDYGFVTYNFGSSIDEPEALHIIDILNKFFSKTS